MIVKVQKPYPNTPTARILLQRGMVALVDPEWYDYLNQFHWYMKKSFHCWYVCRKMKQYGKIIFIRMHRVVADTPADQVCHHVNGDTLDNRSKNLQNMSEFEHAKYYSYR